MRAFLKVLVQAIKPLKLVKLDWEQSFCSSIRGREGENIESVRYTSGKAANSRGDMFLGRSHLFIIMEKKINKRPSQIMFTVI